MSILYSLVDWYVPRHQASHNRHRRNTHTSRAVRNNWSPQIPPYIPVSLLTSVDINELDILVAIGKLKSNLSAGPDGLPPLLFKRVKLLIALPLTLAFRQLLSVSYVPEDWKSAIVTPVHKKGATTSLSNYRPISITFVACKLPAVDL